MLGHMAEIFSLRDSLGYMVSVVAREQDRRLALDFRPLGLTRTGWSILFAIGIGDLEHPSEIAAYVQIDRAAASRTLRKLEEAHLIERWAKPSDRRKTEIRLTATGRKALDAGLPMVRRNFQALDAKLDPAERQEMCRLLGKLIADEPAPGTSV